MGIMRWASAGVLGAFCGYARLRSGALLVPMMLHAGYNLLALGTLRGWLVLDGWPTRLALPTILLAAAPLGLLAAGLLWWSDSWRRPSKESGELSP
jgi:hypothetical protein